MRTYLNLAGIMMSFAMCIPGGILGEAAFESIFTHPGRQPPADADRSKMEAYYMHYDAWLEARQSWAILSFRQIQVRRSAKHA